MLHSFICNPLRVCKSRKVYIRENIAFRVLKEGQKKEEDFLSLRIDKQATSVSRSLVRWSGVDWFSLPASRYLCPR